jgi:hypothetical protein
MQGLLATAPPYFDAAEKLDDFLTRKVLGHQATSRH